MADQHSTPQEATVLLVDDDDNDWELTREGFERSGHRVTLRRVESGMECLAYLKKEGGFADAPTPDLILLDLNLPGMDGTTTMRELLADDRFRHLPVVVLTTSDALGDIRRAYELRCSSYIVKPMDFSRFREIIEDLIRYWFTTVTLPGASSASPAGRSADPPPTS